MKEVVLYDQFGRRIEMREAKTPERREVATVGIRDRWSNYPADNLTPAKLARILKQADAGDVSAQAELFEQMEERDSHLGSQFQTRKLAIQGLEWEVIPASEDKRDADVAEFCAEILGQLDLEDVILDQLDALAKGYSMSEILWDVSEGQAVPYKLEWIPAKKVTFVNSKTPRVLTEDEPSRGVDLAPFKWVYHRYKARSGYDTHAGIMRVCAWMYLFKNYGIKDWVQFCETYGQPTRLGKYAPNASKEDKEALKLAVASIGVDAAGIISKNTEIEFIEAQKYGSLNVYESLVNFCDTQVSRAVLGQTLTSSDGDGTGSRALGEVHGEVRQDLIEADAKSLGKTLTRDVVRPMVGFNYGWDTPMPRIRLLYEPPEDLKKEAETLEIVVNRVGLDVSQEWVSKRFKYPMRQKDETPLLRQGQAPSGTAPYALREVVLKDQVAQGGHPVDAAVEQLLHGGGIAPWGDVIREALGEARSLEDFRDSLEGLSVNMDTTAAAELLRKGLVVAELAGRFDADGR